MSALLQVIGREMKVRALMPVTGAVTALGLVLTARLVEHGRRFNEIAETSIFFAGFFLAAGGLLMGALLLGRDLEGSRSLFWLARPIGVWTTFIGKMIAAIVLVIVTTLLVAVPAILVDPGLIEEPLIFSGGAGFAVGCVALGASLGLLLRNRSGWFLAVVPIFGGYIAGVWIIAEPFTLASVGIVELLGTVGATALIVGLIAAHGIGFARGRHDARRQARTFTLVLTAILGVTLVASWSFGAWILGLDLGDFEQARIRSGNGAIALVGAWREDPVSWGRMFAVDLESGTSIALPPGTWDAAASPRHIAFAAPRGGRGRHEIMTAELGATPRMRTTGVVITGQIGRLGISPEGSRIAVSGPDATQVYDLTGRSLGSFPTEVKVASSWRYGWVTPLFVDRDTLRLYERSSSGDRVVIREADLRTRRIRTVGAISGSIYGFTPGLDRVVVRVDPPKGAPAAAFRRSAAPRALHDARTGAKVFDFPEAGSVIPLADGGFAILPREGGELVRIGPAGAILSTAPFPHGQVSVGSEVRPGVVSFGERPGGVESPMNLTLIDLASGRVLKRIPAVSASGSWWWNAVIDAPGSLAARLYTQGADLYLIDPATLEPEKMNIR